MGIESLLPGLIGAGASLFGGGTDPSLTPEQEQIWKALKRFMQSEHRYARSAPLSSTLEQQGLANESALLSGAQRRNMQGLFGQLGATDLQNPSSANQLRNLAQANTAQQGSLYSTAYQNALQDRLNARRSLPMYLQGMAGLANNPGIPGTNSNIESLLPALFQFGQQWGARGRQQTATPSPGTTLGSSSGTQREEPYYDFGGDYFGNR